MPYVCVPECLWRFTQSSLKAALTSSPTEICQSPGCDLPTWFSPSTAGLLIIAACQSVQIKLHTFFQIVNFFHTTHSYVIFLFIILSFVRLINLFKSVAGVTAITTVSTFSEIWEYRMTDIVVKKDNKEWDTGRGKRIKDRNWERVSMRAREMLWAELVCVYWPSH